MKHARAKSAPVVVSAALAVVATVAEEGGVPVVVATAAGEVVAALVVVATAVAVAVVKNGSVTIAVKVDTRAAVEVVKSAGNFPNTSKAFKAEPDFRFRFFVFGRAAGLSKTLFLRAEFQKT